MSSSQTAKKTEQYLKAEQFEFMSITILKFAI